MTMHIVVHNMAGDPVDFPLIRESTVLNLKERLADHWRVPPLCQSLIVDTTVLLDDSVTLADLCEPEATMHVT